MARKRRRKNWITIAGIAIMAIVAVATYIKTETDWLDVASNPVDGDHYVDFIDCGQGDSTLIVSDGAATLIDATTGSDAEKVVNHLRERGIKKIEHFVLSHPHEDHIGGAAEILEEFQVENIYMKKPTHGTEPTTSVYITLLTEIKEAGMTVDAVEVGDTFSCGSFLFEVLGPIDDYEDLNNQSIILMGELGDTSILFTGDQENSAEKDLVEEYDYALACDILKVGHHGSSGASSNAFLEAADPEYAVISCGADNSYGHPHDELLERLEKHNIQAFRTDLQGTITVTTDGETIELEEAA